MTASAGKSDSVHMQSVTCTRCGWVHMGYTRAQAVAEVERFNAYYDAQPAETQAHFGGRSNIASYERCNAGCGSREFRPFEPGDCPDGCTISPVIYA